MKVIALVGPYGSGKTDLGSILSLRSLRLDGKPTRLPTF